MSSNGQRMTCEATRSRATPIRERTRINAKRTNIIFLSSVRARCVHALARQLQTF